MIVLIDGWLININENIDMMRTRSNYLVKLRIITIVSFFMILINKSVHCQTQRIQKGSILEIRVYGHAELSRTVMVQPDGSIDYPLISGIPIDGYSLDQMREILTVQVSKFIGERAVVTVRFSQTMNIGVTVLGQVAVPGEYIVAKKATVQGAISQAGGSTSRAQLGNIKLIRHLGDSTQTIIIDLYKFYVEGDSSILSSLEDGDLIVVPGLPGAYDIKVIGAVESPGTHKIFTGANILDAIYMAGGPKEQADLKKTQLVSPLRGNTREIEIDIESLLQSNHMAQIPELRPGDVILVPEKKSFWRQLFGIFRDVTSFISPIILILYYTGVLRR